MYDAFYDIWWDIFSSFSSYIFNKSTTLGTKSVGLAITHDVIFKQTCRLRK